MVSYKSTVGIMWWAASAIVGVIVLTCLLVALSSGLGHVGTISVIRLRHKADYHCSSYDDREAHDDCSSHNNRQAHNNGCPSNGSLDNHALMSVSRWVKIRLFSDDFGHPFPSEFPIMERHSSSLVDGN